MAAQDIRRLIAPRSIALVGSSAWTDAVAAGNAAVGFGGDIWRVHPTKPSKDGRIYYRSIDDLPASPDATFIAVPNHEAPNVAAALARRDAGGFVCFTAGFSETGTAAGTELTQALMRNAAAMPFFGPNCYGFVNFFDRVAMLPDQVVGQAIDRGVAVICQSGTLALTLMFNERSLPIGYLITVGNQTRLAVEDLIEILCDDPRVSAFGLYLEGIKNPERFASAAERARAAGKPIAIIKSGRTAAAARTAHSHTGALAGADDIFDAFCRQAGIARCDTLDTLCETLKLFHAGGVLPGRKVLIMGCSGGDMAMTADVARHMELDFAPLPSAPASRLQQLLTERVTVANPLDIHTYLWFDPPALKQVFHEVLHAGYDAVGFMLDCPPEARADTSSFDAVIDVYIEAARQSPTRAALIASLPETLNARTRANCMAGGVTPLQGLREALEALALAGDIGATWKNQPAPVLQLPAATSRNTRTLSEHEGKLALAEFGVSIPHGRLAHPAAADEAAAAVGFPVVVKATGSHLEHKTELGGVILNVRNAPDAQAAGARLAALCDRVLVERMTIDGVAEILVGVIVDPQFGQVLVIGAGGILTELLADSVSLLPPWTPAAIGSALRRLTAYKLLSGYRGKPTGDVPALVDAIASIARYAAAHVETLLELDVNPVIVRPAGHGVVAVDTLIRLRQPD